MFKTFFITLFLSVLVMISGCDSTAKKEQQSKICPECHMPLPASNKNTAFVEQNSKMTYFDDVGCMVLWAKENNIDLEKVKVKVFTNDTKKYEDAFKLNYRIDEKTPMHYGFGAYEHKTKNTIDFNEVILRMLRGENMANPKIRKQILGY